MTWTRRQNINDLNHHLGISKSQSTTLAKLTQLSHHVSHTSCSTIISTYNYSEEWRVIYVCCRAGLPFFHIDTAALCAQEDKIMCWMRGCSVLLNNNSSSNAQTSYQMIVIVVQIRHKINKWCQKMRKGRNRTIIRTPPPRRLRCGGTYCFCGNDDTHSMKKAYNHYKYLSNWITTALLLVE
jgi:hypothetical protein